MQMEWMGMDGQTYINSSVRVEWSESDSTAVCELRCTGEFSPQQQPDSSAHCARCLVQVLALASLLLLLLLRSLTVRTTAGPSPSPSRSPGVSVALLDLPTRTSPGARVHAVQRRSLSAAAVLEKRLHEPFVTARWECCLLATVLSTSSFTLLLTFCFLLTFLVAFGFEMKLGGIVSSKS